MESEEKKQSEDKTGNGKSTEADGTKPQSGFFDGIANAIANNPKTTLGLGAAAIGVLSYLLYDKGKTNRKLKTDLEEIRKRIRKKQKAKKKKQKQSKKMKQFDLNGIQLI